MLERLLLCVLGVSTLAHSAVHRIYVNERSDVPGGGANQYELVTATAYFRVDPQLEPNRIIADIDLAPRNSDGMVEFSADVYVLKPRDSAKSNSTVLLEISNRGGRGLLRQFNFGDPGDRYLLDQGYTLVWVGWQHDVPRDSALLRLYAPVARGVRGIVRAEFVPAERATIMPLADRNHVPYRVLDGSDPEAQLTVRDRAASPRRTIPRSQWHFAEGTQVTMDGGFEPGKFYEVVYRAEDPAIVGLGPAAVRDMVSFLKYGGAETLLGDQRQYMKRAIGFGTSQSGRFLRTFLYYGFNEDEKHRKVFDAVWAHVAGGGRGSFNHRFAQPSRDGHPTLNTFYPTDLFPFTDLEETDEGVTGALLARAMKNNVVPRIFYTNGSYEYWGRAASLIHTTPDGAGDTPLAPDTRIYYLTGTQHGAGSFPPRRAGTVHLANPNDYRFIMRSLLATLQRWLADGVEPPASRYPHIAELTAPAKVAMPAIPGVKLPERWLEAYRLDFGPEFASKGIVSIDPPRVGKAFPTLVPQVDKDGNELAGIRLPELEAPLATYAGWNLKASDGEIYNMTGSYWPFARTKAERAKTGDPRLSIEERYPSREEFLKRVEASARRLATERYILEADVHLLIDRAAKMWDNLSIAPPH